ncbi:hypothetical protein NECAME_17927 [Necator americanus]|uniref:Ras family protein n=1 Tax=Necator americanus TaxID=51031 RepID=W2TI71_NECAM|nr:hypothetical protein NECAME_17927 [Necator americanus]ETN81254.1 hypothetical protein NECAME_17927 [Necator americanus]
MSVSVVLVGTQVDLRWQTSKDTVSTAKGRQLSSQIGAEFFECSALTQHNLKQMFDSAILAALEGRRTIKSPRSQLHTSKIKQSFHRIMSITRKLI